MASKNYKTLADKIFNSTIKGTDRSVLINLEDKYTIYFNREVDDVNELIEIKKFLFERCELLKKQGFPVPFYESINNEKLLITWFHSSYETYSDLAAPNNPFFDIFDWIHQCDGNEFLLACSAYLASLKSQNIFITDKINDGGVDLVAINHLLGEIPTLFLVQAKSKQNSPISREVLLQEIGKYNNLPQKEIYHQYMRPISRHLNGCSFAHVFITNCHIKEDAIKEAFYAKSILINDLRLAFSVSKHFTLNQIKQVGEKIKNDRNSNKYEYDLQYDIANKFNEVSPI